MLQHPPGQNWLLRVEGSTLNEPQGKLYLQLANLKPVCRNKMSTYGVNIHQMTTWSNALACTMLVMTSNIQKYIMGSGHQSISQAVLNLILHSHCVANRPFLPSTSIRVWVPGWQIHRRKNWVHQIFTNLSERFNGFLILALLGQRFAFGKIYGESALGLVSILRHLSSLTPLDDTFKVPAAAWSC